MAIGRHNIALFLCLVLAVPALVGALRRLPLAHGPTRPRAAAAAVLPGGAPAADVAAALRGRALPALPLARAVAGPRAEVARVAVLSAFAWVCGLQRALCDLALGRVMLQAVLLDALGTLLEPSRRRRISRRAGGARRRGLRSRGSRCAAGRDRLLPRPSRRGGRRRGARRPARSLHRRAGRRAARARPRAPDLPGRCSAALRFRPYPEVAEALGALRAAGLRLIVVSNWDVSLHEALARTGLGRTARRGDLLRRVGAAKPAPAIFERRSRSPAASRPPPRSTSATTRRPTSPVRARPGSRRCSSSATALRGLTASPRSASPGAAEAAHHLPSEPMTTVPAADTHPARPSIRSGPAAHLPPA